MAQREESTNEGVTDPQQPQRRQFVETAIQALTSVAALTLFPGAKADEAKNDLPYIERGNETYERARLDAVWNSRKPSRYPDRIVVIKTAAEAVDAIRAANSKHWKVSVRAGGHNWIGNHVRDGGLMLDLSRLSQVEVDTKNERASVEPGVRARDLQKRLNDLGYRFPTATCPTVGVSGHLLGGGASFTTRLDGPSCTYVEAADVVLADGTLIHATDSSHPEIMWAVRGAGPSFFGVVTKFYLRIKPIEKSILAANYLFSAEIAEEFLNWHVDVSKSLPVTTQHNIFAVRALQPQYPGIPMGIGVVAFGNVEEESRAQLEIFEKAPFASKYLAHTPQVPWTHDQGFSQVAMLYPKSFRFRSEALWVDPHQAGFIKLCTEAVSTLPNLHSHILWAPYETHDAKLNACYSGTSPLSLHFYGVSQKPEDDAAMSEWVNGWMNRFRKYSANGGTGKINDNGLTEFPKYFLSPENTRKLETLRTKYDPKGVFYPCLGTPRAPKA
jgi:FAD/FMN-containing dehydrogenase